MPVLCKLLQTSAVPSAEPRPPPSPASGATPSRCMEKEDGIKSNGVSRLSPSPSRMRIAFPRSGGGVLGGALLLVVPLRKKDLQFRKNGLLSREEEGGSDRWFGARGREWETTTHFNRNGVCWGAKDHISSAQKCILLTRHQKTMTPTQPLGGIPGQTFLSYKNGREVVRKKNNLALELGASFLSFCL